MTTYDGIEKNQSAEMLISQEAQQRFLVGLAWDPIKEPEKTKSTFVFDNLQSIWFFFRKALYNILYTKRKDEIGRDKNSVINDLDLDCYIFDNKMNHLHTISTEDNALIDPSKKIYHSGDDGSGTGGMDDEQVHVETRNLPEEYANIFFVVKSDSKYSLDKYYDPVIRLADSKTNKNIQRNAIIPPRDVEAYSYVFCHIYRNEDKWAYKNLDEYTDTGDGVDWKKYLPTLVEV